ncbi:MAG: hypothetical protein IT200_13210, partial [Thermoleophilia bacterium]|nr:hypothetical protein [Thermoleophilia bacterium]
DGLRLTPVAAPQGVTVLDAPPIALQVAGPYPTDAMQATASGRILVTHGPGMVRTVLVPELAQAFDRRPPGMSEALGAAEANAALLRAGDGWRAVVLPSIGDRLPDLGDGPVAIAPDGLRIAVAGDGVVREGAIADGQVLAEHPGPAEALAYAGDRGLVIARGGRLDDGDPLPAVRMLAGASRAPLALAVHDDGMLRLHGPDGPGAPWPSPVGAPRTLGIAADGAWAAIAGGDASAVVRAADGAVAARISGATAIALAAGGRIAIGGPWGLALAGTVEER